MNMSPTNKMNSCALNMRSADERLPSKAAVANPRMLKLLSHSRTNNSMTTNNKRSQASLIDEALEIANSSPDSAFKTSIVGRRKGFVTGRRYSFRNKSGCPMRQRELLTDNTERLQELMRAAYNSMDDFESDCESDLED